MSMPSSGLASSNQRERSMAAWRRAALIVWTLVGVAIVTYCLGFVLSVLSVPVGIVIWTAIIVFCLKGTVAALAARGLSRTAAVTVAYLIMVAVLALLFYVVSSPLLGVGAQFTGIVENAPAYFAGLSDAYSAFSAAHPALTQNPQVAAWIGDVQSSLEDFGRTLVNTGLDSLVDIGSALANTLVCVGFALVVAFWLLLASPNIGREFDRLVGDSHSEGVRFFRLTFSRVVGGYIRGTLLQCAIIGVGCAIAFTAIGVPNAIAFGVICGILNIIPVVGPWLGGAAAAVAALSLGPVSAIVSLLVTIAIQQVVYTFISPKIMSDSVDVHPILVIMSMMCGYAIGWQMSGLVGSLTGMLISIPFAAILKAVFVYYFENRTGRQIVAPDGVFFKGVPSEGDAIDPAEDATATMRARIKARAHKAVTAIEQSARVMGTAESHWHGAERHWDAHQAVDATETASRAGDSSGEDAPGRAREAGEGDSSASGPRSH
jgi:predicted PurR-regulated permease PerM